MTTYQDIELRIRTVADRTAELAFMNKEQIFEVIAEIVAISDILNNFIHDIDIEMGKIGDDMVRDNNTSSNTFKMNASMMEIAIKQRTAKHKADKEWAGRQLTLLSELRMAALAAQRTAE